MPTFPDASTQIDVSNTSSNHLVLTFPPTEALTSVVAQLPYAEEMQPGVWQVALCFESVSVLAGLERGGNVSTDIGRLLGEASLYPACHDGVIVPKRSDKYPLAVWSAWRAGTPLTSLIPGGYRQGKSERWVFPTTSIGTIARLVGEGTLADPEGFFPSCDALVGFDTTTGEFFAFGDPRVQSSMDKFFPAKDVVAAARAYGVDVRFSDDFSKEVYYGEVARNGEGIQPEGIQVSLFPYQRTSVAQLVERTGMGVFLAPGLGKTLIATAAGQELFNRGSIERVFICPPAAVAFQWEQEILRFTGTDPADVVRVHGSAAKRKEAYEAAASASWVIVHQDLLSRDSSFVEQLVDSRTAIVFDEAHRGANYTAARSKQMSALARNAGRRIVMTGTPVVNTVTDWSVVLGSLAIPNLFGGREFSARYQYPNQYNKGFEGFRRLEELAARSRPHFIRWTKADAAPHLPALAIRHNSITPSPEFRKVLVNAHVNAAEELTAQYDHIDDAEAVGNMTAYGMLRALCTSPMLLHNSESDGAKALVKFGGIPKADGPKVESIMKIVRVLQDAGERVVMFSYSREMIKLLAERFTAQGIRHVTYHGETSDKDRELAVRAFTTVDEKASGIHANPTVFLATDAAAEGLNLGKQCSTLVNVDLPWTAGRLDQRYNRIHRVDGTHASYLVVNLTLSGTVEDSILRKVEAKAGIADVLFGERSADELTGRRKGNSMQKGVQEAVREWADTAEIVHAESTISPEAA